LIKIKFFHPEAKDTLSLRQNSNLILLLPLGTYALAGLSISRVLNFFGD